MKSKNCMECDRSHNSAAIVVCKKTKKPVCRDCCTRANGGFRNCIDWNFCWTSFYI